MNDLVTYAISAATLRKRMAAPIPEQPARAVDSSSARDYFWAHSRSFSFASMAFSKRDRRLVGLVYAFCRITDDIVDEARGDVATVRLRLEEWLAKARSAYNGEDVVEDWLAVLMRTSRERNVPFSIIEDLVHGVEQDLSSPRFETLGQLKEYCHGVASTVGLWLCHLNDVREPWMLERAAGLGRAMQITNIIRDVGEDLGRGRLYIPREMLERHGLTEKDLRAAATDGAVPSGYHALVDDMIAVADREYDLAWEAIPRLPAPFATAAAVAAEVYRGIHTRVIRNGYDNLSKRATTRGPSKILLATIAWLRLKWRRLALRRTSVAPILIASAALVGASPSIESVGNDAAIVQLRLLYVQAADDGSAIAEANALIDALPPEQRKAPLIQAFRGAFEIVRAKHAHWPFSKLKHVKRGLPLLDRLVEAHPDDIEIRFLRLVSCYHLPRIMGRKETAMTDVAALCGLLPGTDDRFPADWYGRMTAFVLGTGYLDEECRSDLQEIHAQLQHHSREPQAIAQ